MKRIVNLVLAGAVALSLTACSDKEQEAKDYIVEKILEQKKGEEEYIKNVAKAEADSDKWLDSLDLKLKLCKQVLGSDEYRNCIDQLEKEIDIYKKSCGIYFVETSKEMKNCFNKVSKDFKVWKEYNYKAQKKK